MGQSEEFPAARSGPAAGGGHASVDFHNQRRTSATHASTTDPDARLYKKARGREARLGYLDHVLMEHRSGRHRGGPLVSWVFTFTAAALRPNSMPTETR